MQAPKQVNPAEGARDDEAAPQEQQARTADAPAEGGDDAPAGDEGAAKG